MELRALIDAPAQEIPADVWCGLVPEGYVTLLHGDGGSGKTMMGIALAVAVAAGLPFLGEPTVQGEAIIFDAELRAEVVMQRAARIARSLNLENVPRDVTYHRVTESWALTSTRAEVAAAVRDRAPRLVIVDSLTAIAPGIDQFAAEAMAGMLKDLESFECAVVLVDHVAKPNAGAPSAHLRPYGAVAKANLSRSLLRLTRKGDAVQLVQTKNSFGPLHSPIAFTLDEQGIPRHVQDDYTAASISDSGQLRRVLDALHPSEARTVEEIAERATMPKKSVSNRLSELKTDGRAESPERGRWRRRG
jgi:predicted ATP-dependent serine protease